MERIYIRQLESKTADSKIRRLRWIFLVSLMENHRIVSFLINVNCELIIDSRSAMLSVDAIIVQVELKSANERR